MSKRTDNEQLAYQSGIIESLGTVAEIFRSPERKDLVITFEVAAGLVDNLQEIAKRARQEELNRQKEARNE